MILLLVGLALGSAELCSSQNVSAQVDYAWPEHIGHGYFPVSVDVENKRIVASTYTLSFHSNYSFESRVSVELRLEPGERRELEVMLPSVLGYAPYDLELIGDSAGYECYASGIGPQDKAFGDTILMVRELEGGAMEELLWASNLDVQSEQLRILRPADLSANWVAYTSVDLVLIDAQGGLPNPAELQALLRWVRMGGALVLRGEGAHTLVQSEPELERWVKPRFEQRATLDDGMVRGLDGYSMGLGTLVVQEEQLQADMLLLSALEAAWDTPLRRWVPRQDQGVGVPRPQIPGIGVLPAGRFAMLLMAVGLLLGPGNRLVLRVFKRPALMLLSTPILALVSAGAIVGYGLYTTGLGAQSASYTVTYLDQASKRATVQEVRQLYLGAALATGLRPAAETWDFPLSADYDERLEIELGPEGRKVSGSLLPSRVAVRQVLLGERSARLSLELSGEQVRNELDTELQALVLRDAAGEYWSLDKSLAEGASATLSKVASPEQGLVEIWASEMGARGQHFDFPGPDQDMPPGSYVARTERSPFADQEGLSLRERVGEHHVVGLLELP